MWDLLIKVLLQSGDKVQKQCKKKRDGPNLTSAKLLVINKNENVNVI